MLMNELAQELGISKQALTKRIKALGFFDDLERVSNKYRLNEEQVKQIKDWYSSVGVKNDNKSQQEFTILKEQLMLLNEQLQQKDLLIQQLIQQNTELTTALTQEQQLHAVEKQQQQLLLESHSNKSFFSFFKRNKTK